jgi:hypothetical protein
LSPNKKISERLPQSQAEMEDRPMNESLRHTIVVESEGDEKGDGE